MAATTEHGQQAAAPAGERRVLQVARSGPGSTRPRVDSYAVPAGPHTTVLDALRYIRLHLDRSLTLRYSCCHASCGTCGVRVNGREELACVTSLAELPAGPVLVEPLAGAAVEHDLVISMHDFYDKMRPAGRPLTRLSENARAGSPDLSAAESLVRFEDCMECGLCISACPIAGSDARYLGPAALAAGWRVVTEPRGADPEPVLDWMDDEHGCWRCHASFECSAACPSGVDPAGAIMAVRRELTARELRRVARRGRRRRCGQ